MVTMYIIATLLLAERFCYDWGKKKVFLIILSKYFIFFILRQMQDLNHYCFSNQCSFKLHHHISCYFILCYIIWLHNIVYILKSKMRLLKHSIMYVTIFFFFQIFETILKYSLVFIKLTKNIMQINDLNQAFFFSRGGGGQ